MNTKSGEYYLKLVANILTLIGALNWGLIGINNFNLVAYLFNPTLSRIIYTIVGISGIYLLIKLFIIRKL
ncbi:hypothetical protein IM40_03740 [Candidatus Paracaedimonas acanthamoebae]|nr:hypothetical protein IM40_03740 [Candidatus Paracaedimonas acanthamoebae]